MAFAARTRRPPRTLTDAETARLLKVTGEHRDGFRDHLIISLALGCALRESEIVGLDFRDVTRDGRTPKRTIHLRTFKGSKRDGASAEGQRVPLPDGCFYKLEKYLRIVLPGSGAHPELTPEAPLFESREGHRLSDRRVRSLFRRWQEVAGFSKPYHFHALRHTSLTNLYRSTRDINLVSRFARHASIVTTTIYAHVSDEDVLRAAKGLAS